VRATTAKVNKLKQFGVFMAAAGNVRAAIAVMGFRLGSHCRRLVRNHDGATTLEFAFVGGMLTLLIAGILDVALVLFVNAALEGGVRDAGRFGITGFTPATVSRETTIVNIINGHLFGLYTVTSADISEKVYSTFGNIGQPEPYIDSNGNGHYDLGEPFTDINGNGQWDQDMAASGAGGAGQVVVYQVAVNWAPVTPLLLPFVDSSGKIKLTASLVVRNEPFGS
jgi:Flp pilus assembly protein TadG